VRYRNFNRVGHLSASALEAASRLAISRGINQGYSAGVVANRSKCWYQNPIFLLICGVIPPGTSANPQGEEEKKKRKEKRKKT
jgi:hypothetical protein